jgi:hypothetical protein
LWLSSVPAGKHGDITLKQAMATAFDALSKLLVAIIQHYIVRMAHIVIK